ncbi:MAG TPA: hypothetical protein VFP91_16385 [Vicinamibacterales bacterium]|nr:hypothetical protein [Vicinamibacterales bacterium]
MTTTRALLPLAISAALAVAAGAAQQLPLEPLRESGQSVAPAYEGWYRNTDGTISLLLGYFNRNLKQEVDIPIGPDNHVDPGGPDRGQPTHFLTRRQWGMFTIVVPGDFPEKKLTWTLTLNGRTTTVPMTLHKDYEISPFKDPALGNTPPVVQLEGSSSKLQGPPRGTVPPMNASVGKPVSLRATVTDDMVVDPRRPPDAPKLFVSWSKFRGTGLVHFLNPKSADTTATFDTPGEYIVRLQANDLSGEGGGGFQCCWTSVLLKVTVR